MPHYKDTEQISELSEYKFELPKFGKSTTDPTYYEPAATRIANMRKSAQSGKALYDFEHDKDKKFSEEELLKLHDEIRITPGRKPGLTREEISQNLHNAESKVENMKEDKKAEKEAFEKSVNDNKAMLDALSSKDSSNSDKSE